MRLRALLLRLACCRSVSERPQVIGVVVAETEAIARRAARLVEVQYQELPAIMSCEEAVEANSFYR